MKWTPNTDGSGTMTGTPAELRGLADALAAIVRKESKP
jgi:hypothetical protein